jgi:uncharacterized protein with WD repeat
MPREYRIQWHVERIADKVSAIADTHPLHLPPRNDAEAEALEEREGESDKLSFAPGSLLHFDITGARTFRAQIDGRGPLITVTFSPKMRRARVVRGDAPAIRCSAHAHDVAMAILGLDPEGNPLAIT